MKKRGILLLAVLSSFVIFSTAAYAEISGPTEILGNVWDKITEFFSGGFGNNEVAYTRLVLFIMLWAVFYGVGRIVLKEEHGFKKNITNIVAIGLAALGTFYMPAGILLSIGGVWATILSLIFLGIPIGFGIWLWWYIKSESRGFIFLKGMILGLDLLLVSMIISNVNGWTTAIGKNVGNYVEWVQLILAVLFLITLVEFFIGHTLTREGGVSKEGRSIERSTAGKQLRKLTRRFKREWPKGERLFREDIPTMDECVSKIDGLYAAIADGIKKLKNINRSINSRESWEKIKKQLNEVIDDSGDYIKTSDYITRFSGNILKHLGYVREVLLDLHKRTAAYSKEAGKEDKARALADEIKGATIVVDKMIDQFTRFDNVANAVHNSISKDIKRGLNTIQKTRRTQDTNNIKLVCDESKGYLEEVYGRLPELMSFLKDRKDDMERLRILYEKLVVDEKRLSEQ